MSSVDDQARRLGFFGVGEADYRVFPRIARAIRAYAPRALNAFYTKVAETPDVARFFGSPQAMNHAKDKQFHHWTTLFDGRADARYFESAERIGDIHARIGLAPTWYVGGYAMVLEKVIQSTIGGRSLSPLQHRKARTVATLVKLALLDMEIALSAYFQAEEAKRTSVVEKLGAALEALAQGDFTHELRDLPSSFAKIEEDYEAMRQRVGSTLDQVAAAANSMRTGSTEISQASDDLANRTEHQAGSLEETSAAMAELTDGIHRTAQGAAHVRQSVADAHGEASSGGRIAQRAVEAMSEIQQSARSIAQIIGVIDGIAFQTNLLALNAGVEAARAGDAGKGFAVVASEVRALAQRSADSAKDIKELIESSTEQVEKGAGLVRQSDDAFGRIVEKVGEIAEQTAQIAELTGRQAESLQQVNGAVTEMDQVTQQNAAMVEQSNAAARSLAGEAQRLSGLVSHFQTGGDAVAVTPAANDRPPSAGRTTPRPVALRGNLALKMQDEDPDWNEF